MLRWDEVSPYIDHPDGAQEIYDYALYYSMLLPENYIFMEVGCWKGGTTMMLMQAVKDSGKDRWVFSVDPYGSKPFKLGTGIQKEADYNDDIYRTAMTNFNDYAVKLGVKHYHWRMTSEDFFKIADQITFYDQGEKLPMEFGFVYLDGDHDGEVVEQELTWLAARMPKGDSMIGLDDVPYITQRGLPKVAHTTTVGAAPDFRAFWVVDEL